MRTSNKVLLAAIGTTLAIFMAFILVMGLTMKNLIDRQGRSALVAPPVPVELAAAHLL